MNQVEPQCEDHALWIFLCTPYCLGRPGRNAMFRWLWLQGHIDDMGFIWAYRLVQGLEHVPDDLLEIVIEAVQRNYIARHIPVTLPALLEDCRQAQAKLDRIGELNQLRRSLGLDDRKPEDHC